MSRYQLKLEYRNKRTLCQALNDDIRKKQMELDALVRRRRDAGEELTRLQQELSAVNAEADAKYRGAA